MRTLSIALLLAFATPVAAEDFSTALSGLGVAQNGAAITLEEQGGAYVAQIVPGPFTLTFVGDMPDVIAVTFGQTGLFEMMDLPPETGLFGPGTAYAREEGPGATHFMTDPLCGSQYYGPGFNVLDASRSTAEGFPVAGLQVDSASRRCDAEGRLPTDVELLGQIDPLYAVVRTDAGDARLILRFVGS